MHYEYRGALERQYTPYHGVGQDAPPPGVMDPFTQAKVAAMNAACAAIGKGYDQNEDKCFDLPGPPAPPSPPNGPSGDPLAIVAQACTAAGFEWDNTTERCLTPQQSKEKAEAEQKKNQQNAVLLLGGLVLIATVVAVSSK